jgi:hypothetical protein
VTPRPPSDGVVALRSLPRRFRALFAGLGEDESPDALAHRAGDDGSTALGHLAAATGALTAGASGLGQVLVADDPTVDPIPVGPVGSATGTVEERLAQLGWEADALAERVEHLGADAWARQAHVAGTGAGIAISAADLLWQAVDAAVEHLRAAEHTLDQARRAR